MEGLPYEEPDLNSYIEWMLLIGGIIIACLCIYCFLDSRRHGSRRYYKKLAAISLLNFVFIVSGLVFRYVPIAPAWVDFISYWSACLLLGLMIFVQFDFFAAILILAQVDIYQWVPRFRMVWSLLYLALTFPMYFLIGTLGQQPFSWIIGIYEYGRKIFSSLCAIYDLVQGITSIILLSRHLRQKSRFTVKGRHFTDNHKECTRLFQLTLTTFLLTLTALAIEIYEVFDYSPIVQKLGLFKIELVCTIAIFYYFQMLRVSSIVLSPRKEKVATLVTRHASGTTTVQNETALTSTHATIVR